MAYCAQSNVETRIGSVDLVSLSDYDGDGAADAAVVAAAVADAGALIDTYLGVRFSVPVSPVPAALKTRAVNLTVYFLRLGRDSVTEDVRKQYEDDLAWLRDVVAGKVNLGAAEKPSDAGGAPTVQYDVDGKHFDREKNWL